MLLRCSSCIEAQANFIQGGGLLDVCLYNSSVDRISGAMVVGA